MPRKTVPFDAMAVAIHNEMTALGRGFKKTGGKRREKGDEANSKKAQKQEKSPKRIIPGCKTIRCRPGQKPVIVA